MAPMTAAASAHTYRARPSSAQRDAAGRERRRQDEGEGDAVVEGLGLPVGAGWMAVPDPRQVDEDDEGGGDCRGGRIGAQRAGVHRAVIVAAECASA